MFTQNSSFLVLYSTDVEKTHQFYRALGVPIKQKESDKVVVTLGDFDVHFILNTTEPFAEYQYIAEAGMYGQGVLFYIEAENIEESYSKIKESGGVLKAPIQANHWGCREFLFEDPNGYKFAVYQE